MSSATAPARASSRHAPPAIGWLAGPLRLPGHDLLPARRRDGGPGRLRADHGAVGLVDRLHRPQTRLGLHDLPQPGRVRGHRRRRPGRRLPDAGAARGGALGAADPRRGAGCSSCSCSARWAMRVGGNQNWIRVGPITVQPSEIIKLGLVLTGGLILAAKRKHLHSLSHVARALPRARRGAVSIGVVAPRPRPRHRAHPRRDRRRGAVRRRRPVALVRLRRRPVRRDGRRLRRHQPQPAGPLRRLARAATPTSSAPPASRSTAATRWPTAAGSASGSARAARSGACSPSRTTTSSSRSSARSSGCPAPSRSCCSSPALALACYRLVTRTDDLFVRIATAGDHDVDHRPGR